MSVDLVRLVSRISVLAAVAITYIVGWTAGLVLLVTSSVFLNWKTAWLVIRTLPRDAVAIKRYLQLVSFLRLTQLRQKTPTMFFAEFAKKHPERPMFYYGDRTWTFGEADRYTNQIANFFKDLNLKAGDDVAIVMENCPEMVFMFLGLAKIGVASALVNTNLRKSPLLHSIRSVKTKAVIFTPTTAGSLMEVRQDIKSLSTDGGVQMLCYGMCGSVEDLGASEIKQLISQQSATPPTYRGKLDDRFLYVFTSGTTGLPKAAIVKNYRYLMCAAVAKYLARLKSEDTLYIYLPMYHTSGGIMGVGPVILFGTSGAMAPKFSASKFWSDCIRYNCTVSHYIGEICRYLHVQPPRPEDKAHSIRMMYGNGMKASLWPKFIERFNVRDIKELYGASEGNANIMNMDNVVGSVGCIPTICRLSMTAARLSWNRFLIKVDPLTGKPLRGPDGLCMLCGPREAGEWVATINPKKPELAFDGYTDKSSSSKKTYSDVIVKGDLCFATGDILEYDELGNLYFKDRTGDTYRWKGENVSTAEVENVISKYSIMNDCVVYGISVPGVDGKAGMVALLDPNLDYAKGEHLKELLARIKTELPSYAIPIMVRLTRKLEATSTFKLIKTQLVKEAYDLDKVKDPLFILDVTRQQYVPFDENILERIRQGVWRL
ncbi:long-chain fatty acid transport protein 4-like [Galendromus occidentalis]|uniref:Long-chain-fatty-acid--CoA ligase n=1 Tax=Galendromus occidentalis TaxID=34638 RepID=A0AAJ7SGY1_9ACAR|nr:long-chain fatty acid transport protein 4-like [Galendromus occidentalis]